MREYGHGVDLSQPHGTRAPVAELWPEAAEAFATARTLSPEGALAQDALAREVESWARAAEAATAQERAREYLARYPHGRRAKVVRVLGGLE